MHRRQFLGMTSLGLGATALAGFAPSAVPKNLIVMYANGGWDPALGLDPKVGLPTVSSPPGTVGSVGNITFFESEQAPAVRAYFEKHGAVSAVLRGVNLLALSHETCVRYLLTGSADDRAPDVAAIAAASLSPERALPYLLLGEKALPGPFGGITGRTGLTNQLGALIDPASAPPPLDTATPLDDTDQALIQGWLRGRVDRRRERYATSSPVYEDFLLALDRGNLLYEHRGAFTSDPSFLGRTDLAVYALASQMSRAVLIDSQMNWDTHILGNQQLGYYDEFFSALDHLLDALAATPGAAAGSTLLDETLVMAVSEMGRTPLTNPGGGKDHWPYTSFLLAGGPVRGDRVLGATDDNLVGLPVSFETGDLDLAGGRVVAPAELLAGVLEAIGADPEPWFQGVDPYRAPFAG